MNGKTKEKLAEIGEDLGDLVIEAFLHPSHSLLGFRTGWTRTKCQKRGQTNNMDSALYRCRQQLHSPTETKNCVISLEKLRMNGLANGFFKKTSGAFTKMEILNICIQSVCISNQMGMYMIGCFLGLYCYFGL